MLYVKFDIRKIKTGITIFFNNPLDYAYHEHNDLIENDILDILLFNSVPEQVVRPEISDTNSSGFVVWWSPPRHPNGQITGYDIKVSVGNVTYASINTTCINEAQIDVCMFL